MKDEGSMLDSEELLHLAMHSDKPEQTIDYLKRVLEINGDNSQAYYLLGATHAQIGMYDRAILEMSRAVELDPTLSTAHFQLGLLHLTSGQVEAASQAWSALDDLGESNPLYLFKRGMLSLAKDEFDACIEDLTKGIALNQINSALNDDMQKIIDNAKETRNTASITSESSPADKNTKGGQHILLSAYKSDDETEH
jgi:tetratricopeptide (TPR) repeat protein